MKRIDKDLAAITKKLSSPGFVERAPREVVEEALALKRSLEDARVRLEEAKKVAEEL
jgi:valyl-tRNA synthetase